MPDTGFVSLGGYLDGAIMLIQKERKFRSQENRLISKVILVRCTDNSLTSGLPDIQQSPLLSCGHPLPIQRGKKNGLSNFLDCPVFHFLKQKGFTLTYIVCFRFCNY